MPQDGSMDWKREGPMKPEHENEEETLDVERREFFSDDSEQLDE